jgi:hypothetical protein
MYLAAFSAICVIRLLLSAPDDCAISYRESDVRFSFYAWGVSRTDTQSGRRYRVIYRKPDHIQTQKRGFRTKRDAELFLAKVEIDKSRGAYVDSVKSRVLRGEWLDAWMASRSDWRETSRERARGIVVRHVKPELGGYPPASSNHQLVQNWAGALSKSQEPASVHKIVNVLRPVVVPPRRFELRPLPPEGEKWLDLAR